MAEVSIIVCAYKPGAGFSQVLDAFLAQTFTDFEVLVINDAPEDDLGPLLESKGDDRLKYRPNPHNQGAIWSRNRGLGLAEGTYIACCDHDDVWHREKLEKQIHLLRSEPALVACGTYYQIIQNGKRRRVVGAGAGVPSLLRWRQFFANQFLHSSLLIRRSVLKENDITYRAAFKHADDWALVFDLLACGPMDLVPDVLVDYHLHLGNASLQESEIMWHTGAAQLYAGLERHLGLAPRNGLEQYFYKACVLGTALQNRENFCSLVEFLDSLCCGFQNIVSLSEREICLIHQDLELRKWVLLTKTASRLGFGFLWQEKHRQHIRAPSFKALLKAVVRACAASVTQSVKQIFKM